MWIRTLNHVRHYITNDTRFQALTIAATAAYCKTLLYSKSHEHLLKRMIIQAILWIRLTQTPALGSSQGMCAGCGFKRGVVPRAAYFPWPNRGTRTECRQR